MDDLILYYTDHAFPVWFILLCFALLIAGLYLDWHYSSKPTGISENNRLWRDDFGQFQSRKYVIASAILITALLALTVFVSSHFAFLAFAAGPIAIVYAFAKLRKDYLNYRERQITFLRGLKNVPIGLDDTQLPASIAFYFGWAYKQGGPGVTITGVTTRGNKTVYGMFPWVYSTLDPIAAIPDLQAKLYALAQKPESEWFPE